jgi:hypothetical protein
MDAYMLKSQPGDFIRAAIAANLVRE